MGTAKASRGHFRKSPLKRGNAMNRPMPNSTKEMIQQLWFIVIGTNHEGLVTEFKAFYQKWAEHHQQVLDRLAEVEKKLPRFWTREDHEAMHQKYVAQLEEQKRAETEDIDRRHISTRDWIMIAIVALGMIVPVILEKVIK
jgi:hypothetical protein